MSDYTYFYAFDEKTEDGFTEHQFIDCLSIEYLDSALEQIDMTWYNRCGVVSDVEAYAKTVLEPYLGDNKPEDLELDEDNEERLKELYDFMMKWKNYKIMVFSEEHFLTA